MTELDNAIEVELEPGLRNYRLPPAGSTEELVEAIRRSWNLLRVAPARITAPLLAATYAAPLSEMMTPDFALWIWGGTGSYKSTLAALFLSHFGDDFSETNLPLSFESTSNALERMLFLTKDVLVIVDDWRPGVTRADGEDMDRKAQRLLRAVGNRQGRGRMTSYTTLRESYPPRGMVAATAEALPEGPAFESAAVRSLSINLSRGEVDLKTLSESQQSKRVLSMAMAGYVGDVAAHYDKLACTLAHRRQVLRDKLRDKLPGSHPRTPDNAAILIVALRQLRDYTVAVGAMDEQEANRHYKRAVRAVLAAARAHVEATSGGDPSTRFIEILLSLFEASRAHLVDRENKWPPRGCTQLGWCEISSEDGKRSIYEPSGERIGWADEEYLYLHPDLAYAAVSSFVQRGGIPFGIKPKALWNALGRSGKSLTDAGRKTTTARIEGKSKRVIQIPRTAVFGQEAEEQELF
jgi:hypothetical protein